MKKIYGIIFGIILLSFGNAVTAEEFEDWQIEDLGIEDEDNYEEDSEEIESQGSIKMTGEFLDGDILKINVIANGMQSPILGIAFHLEYEAEKLAFLKYSPGEFLERGGDPFYLVKNDEVKQKIIFGETLRRDDNFPVGDGNVSEFYFQIMSDEVFEFKFENSVVSTLDTVRQDLDKITFENLMLDKNNLSEAGIYADKNDLSQNVGSDTFGLSLSFESLFLIFFTLALIASFVIIFFIKKKQGKFRASVN